MGTTASKMNYKREEKNSRLVHDETENEELFFAFQPYVDILPIAA